MCHADDTVAAISAAVTPFMKQLGFGGILGSVTMPIHVHVHVHVHVYVHVRVYVHVYVHDMCMCMCVCMCMLVDVCKACFITCHRSMHMSTRYSAGVATRTVGRVGFVTVGLGFIGMLHSTHINHVMCDTCIRMRERWT